MNIFKRSKTIFSLLLAVIFIFSLACLSFGAEEETSTADTQTTEPASSVYEIYDYADLLRMTKDPSGTYRLMADIDLADVIWEPLYFSGTLEGNGHTIFNISVNQTSADIKTTYDGSHKTYETYFAGFFGILENASVTDLNLLGIKINIETAENCFVAPLAGYIDKSRVIGCTMTGEEWLYTSGKISGMGGICGFGNGQIEDCTTNMTIVSIDTDEGYKGQEFMGGAYASGCIDLKRNTINFSGYDSEYGLLHSGGLVGTYMAYDQAEANNGYLTNNAINGKISFFEANEEDRAAYCDAEIGEIINWTFESEGNIDNFTADEHFEYETLLPHYCASPVYEDNIYESSHKEFGYTLHSCTTCGEYSYRSDYRPLAHEVLDWTVTVEPTEESEGIRQGSCTQCGEVVYERVPKVVAAQETKAENETEEVKSGRAVLGRIILVVVIVIIVLLAVMYIMTSIKNARIKRRKAERMKRARRIRQKQAMRDAHINAQRATSANRARRQTQIRSRQKR